MSVPQENRSTGDRKRGDALISTRPFRFKLQPVLDVRARELDDVLQRLAQEETKRQAILRQIEGVEAAMEGAYHDYHRLADKGQLPMVSSERFSSYLSRLKTRRSTYQQHLAEQDARVNAVREELKTARIRQKSLELLKDKQAKRFQTFLLKEEEKFASEMTLIRWTHA